MKQIPPLLQLYILVVFGLVVVVMFYNLSSLSILFFAIAAAALGFVLFKTSQ